MASNRGNEARDIAAQLVDLARLRDQGVLSMKEFEQAKSRVLQASEDTNLESGGAAHVGSTTRAPVTDRPNPILAPTGWKMFAHEKFGYSLKYPADWTVGLSEDGLANFEFTVDPTTGSPGTTVNVSTPIPIPHNVPANAAMDAAVEAAKKTFNASYSERQSLEVAGHPAVLELVSTTANAIAMKGFMLHLIADGKYYNMLGLVGLQGQPTEIELRVAVVRECLLSFQPPASPAAASTKVAAVLSTQATIHADWKTFTHEQFGYSLRYPADWTVDMSAEQTKFTLEVTKGAPAGTMVIVPTPTPAPDDAPANALDVIFEGSKKGWNATYGEKQALEVAGHPAMLTSVSTASVMKGYMLLLIAGGQCYVVVGMVAHVGPPAEIERRLRLVRECLLSLRPPVSRVIAPREVTADMLSPGAVPVDWKSFTHDQFGYSLRYPTDWKVELSDNKPAQFTLETVPGAPAAVVLVMATSAPRMDTFIELARQTVKATYFDKQSLQIAGHPAMLESLTTDRATMKGYMLLIMAGGQGYVVFGLVVLAGEPMEIERRMGLVHQVLLSFRPPAASPAAAPGVVAGTITSELVGVAGPRNSTGQGSVPTETSNVPSAAPSVVTGTVTSELVGLARPRGSTESASTPRRSQTSSIGARGGNRASKHARYGKNSIAWVVSGVIVVVAIVGGSMFRLSEEHRFSAALAPFEQHLASEDFAAARNDLRAAQAVNTKDPRLQDAQVKLQQAQRYRDGQAFLRSNQPAKAVAALEPIQGYRDVPALLVTARYAAAKAAIASKNWEDADRYLAIVPSSFRDVASLRHQADDALSLQFYNDAMKAKSDKDYVTALACLNIAKRFGGPRLPDIERQIALVQSAKEAQDKEAARGAAPPAPAAAQAPPAPQAAAPLYDEIVAGYVGRIVDPAGGTLTVLDSWEAWDEVLDALGVHDMTGAVEAGQAHFVCHVASGTHVLKLADHGAYERETSRVRVLAGPCAGQAGWVLGQVIALPAK